MVVLKIYNKEKERMELYEEIKHMYNLKVKD